MCSLLTGSRLGCIINHASRAATRRPPFTTHKDITRSFRSASQQQGQPALAEKPTHVEFLPDASKFPESTDSLVEKNITHSHASPARTFEQEIQKPHGNEATLEIPSPAVPLYHRSSKFERVPYWQKIPRWSDVSEEQFLTYSWGTAKNVQGKEKLREFLKEVLPEIITPNEQYQHIRTRDEFVQDVMDGIDAAPMSIRLTPHILSSVDWNNALEDPIRLQFIPMKSTFLPDHPMLTLDSLHETEDSPCEGLVHRYVDKALFLACSVCPLYCRYCTRSYAVGANTLSVTKNSFKPKRQRWEECFQYISRTPTLQDIVISGGDSYLLQPEQVRLIGERLLSIPHIRRFRFASKGLCVSPSRTLDRSDSWTDELIRIVWMGKERGKHVALHTHFNHPNEFSWVTREAAQKLFANGVTVRNQSVLLRGVNDDVATMGRLIRELADNNIQPVSNPTAIVVRSGNGENNADEFGLKYYVYQGDMVQGVEDLRTSLQTILDLECQIRGSIGGFVIPQFVVDLPGGGGKRLAASYESYDRKTGVSKFVAPAVKGRGKENKIYEYYDPLPAVPGSAVGDILD